MSTISSREQAEIDRANDSRSKPVVFVHGLWLLASSWDRWRRLFEHNGYVTLAPSWPDDPETVEEARRDPGVFARKGVQQVTDHFADVLRRLNLPAAIIGHAFGGLIAQKLAAMGLSMATVAIVPAPFRGLLPLPLSSLKAALPVLGNPVNYSRAVSLTFSQFRYAFANAVGEEEARELYETYSVPAPGAPLFQMATANLNPRSQTRADIANPNRGALLLLGAQKDNSVPHSMVNAAYKRQMRNPGYTEFHEIANRGHSLVIDSGWQAVAEIALQFVKQHHRQMPTVTRPEYPAPPPEQRL